jgi:hypothetical protein
MEYRNWAPVRAPSKAVCRMAAHHQRSVRRKFNSRVPGTLERGWDEVWPLIWNRVYIRRSSCGVDEMAMATGRVRITCSRKVSNTRAGQLDAQFSQRGQVWPLIWNRVYYRRSSCGVDEVVMTPGRVRITCSRKVSNTRARQLDAQFSQRGELHLQTVSFGRLGKKGSSLTG